MAQDILTARLNTTATGGGGGFSMHGSSLASTEPSYPPCCRQGFGFRREVQLKQQFPVRKTKPEHSGTDLHKALFLRLHLLREEWKRNRAEMLMDGRPKWKPIKQWKILVLLRLLFETTTSTEAFHRLIIIIPLVSDTKNKKLFLWPTRSGHKIVTLSL